VTFENAQEWAALPMETRREMIRHFYETDASGLSGRLMALIRAPKGYGVYASTGPNYQFAIFGRDSVTVAEDLLEANAALSKEILLSLARLQGTSFNSEREEEVGKIHHEYRRTRFNGEEVTDTAKHVLAMLSPNWGGTGDELRYYGTVDATPLFVRAVCHYCDRYGADLLDERVTTHDGHETTMRECVRAGARWIADKVRASQWQLLEFKRLNPRGLPYQAWKDSDHAYLHLDGTAANADGGIASVEVQGYAYDALIGAATQLATSEEESQAWRTLAAAVQQQVVERLWMPGERYFAMGCDRDEQGAMRQIATLTSNAGALLNSRLLLDLPEDSRRQYVEPIVGRLMEHEFLTDAGIRLRSLQHADLMPFADYHGSLVTWPCETHAVACGLQLHGYIHEAAELENRLLRAVFRAGEFYEFFLVNRDGKVKYHYRSEHPDEPQFHTFGAANTPEPGQAWTISAILRIVNERQPRGIHLAIQPATIAA